MKKRVCALSGSRADYGLLRWTMHEIQNSSDLNLQLVVTGSHLSSEYGSTYQEIESDGFKIDHKVAILDEADNANGVSRALGFGVIRFADVFSALAPDILLILGDRYEVFAGATAATVLQIPIAHCHGGELTEGAIDDAFRHSITKMAHLHFVASEEYRHRVIQLGEDPARVFNVGAFGLECIERTELLADLELQKIVGQDFGKYNLLIAYHPETLSPKECEANLWNLLTALDQFPDVKLYFSLSNADENGRFVNQLIREYVRKNAQRAVYHANLGQSAMYSLMKRVDAIVGNSSSGIIEAPALGLPTLNIGDRQKGRIRTPSIIDCKSDKVHIEKALATVLTEQSAVRPEGHLDCQQRTPPSKIVTKHLRKHSREQLIKKQFYNLKVN